MQDCSQNKFKSLALPSPNMLLHFKEAKVKVLYSCILIHTVFHILTFLKVRLHLTNDLIRIHVLEFNWQCFFFPSCTKNKEKIYN